MSETIASLKPILDKLNDAERIELIDYLLMHATDADDEEAFLQELDRRGSEIDSGTAKLVPADEVFRELRQKLEGFPDPDWENAWAAELTRRDVLAARGEITALLWPEASAKLRKRYISDH